MAGPPYATDDPEPVEFRHWEIYVASQASRTPNGWSGTLPFLDVNYGAFPNVHLHLMVPFAFVRPRHEPRQYGYGDTELGAKVRFIQETAWVPQIATFPTIELPSGNEDRGLGAGHVQTFLPLWLQKSAGPWTTYGGGGYWVNPGEGTGTGGSSDGRCSGDSSRTSPLVPNFTTRLPKKKPVRLSYGPMSDACLTSTRTIIC